MIDDVDDMVFTEDRGVLSLPLIFERGGFIGHVEASF